MRRPVDTALVESFDRLAPDVISYDSEPNIRYRSFMSFCFDGRFLAPSDDTQFLAQRSFHKSFDARGVSPPEPQLVAALASVVADVLDDELLPNARYSIGVNQIRVVATPDRDGIPAPPFHRDGFDFSCHIAVARRNVVGGVSVLALGSSRPIPLVERCLGSGEYLLFDDRHFVHTATPVRCGHDATAHGVRDMIILDFARIS